MIRDNGFPIIKYLRGEHDQCIEIFIFFLTTNNGCIDPGSFKTREIKDGDQIIVCE